MKKERIVSLDILRSIAIILVVVLHSISLGGALSAPMLTPAWTLALYLKHLASACVPLFLLLTGYLQNKKVLSAKYYRGIIPLYLSYFLISLITAFARTSFDSTFDSSLSIYRIFNFTANDYAWYFEMYIGLFLLIPFLNLAYHGLKVRRHKLILIFTLVFLTVLPELCKSFAPYYADYTGVALDIIPDFFADLYPITYYFIGAYICEYRPAPSRILRAVTVLAAPMIPTALCMIFSKNRGSYAWYMLGANASPTVLLTAILIFLLFYDIKIKNRTISLLSRFISDVSFETYLFSFIFDSYVYGIGGVVPKLTAFFQRYVPSFLADGYLGLPAMLSCLSVFSASIISAWILRSVIIKPVNLLISRIFDKAG